MNTHKNARLTYLRRLEMVQDITERGLAASEAAAKQGVSAVTARKWHGRYLAGGAAALADKSSRPQLSPRAVDPSVAMTIVELRRKLFLQARIAAYTGVSKATATRSEPETEMRATVGAVRSVYGPRPPLRSGLT